MDEIQVRALQTGYINPESEVGRRLSRSRALAMLLIPDYAWDGVLHPGMVRKEMEALHFQTGLALGYLDWCIRSGGGPIFVPQRFRIKRDLSYEYLWSTDGVPLGRANDDVALWGGTVYDGYYEQGDPDSIMLDDPVLGVITIMKQDMESARTGE